MPETNYLFILIDDYCEALIVLLLVDPVFLQFFYMFLSLELKFFYLVLSIVNLQHVL